MKKRLKALILTVILVVGILGVSIVAYACGHSSYSTYNKYRAYGYKVSDCSAHSNCEIWHNYYEEDRICNVCGEMSHVTYDVFEHTNP